MTMQCTRLERPARVPCSLLADVTIGPGCCDDWRALAALHYRNHALGGLDRLFVMRYRGDRIGVIAYCLAAANCGPRNRALRELVDRLPRRGRLRFWNQHLRTISRVVIDPNWRGLGLAVHLVRETLPQAGTPYVEAMAAMAGVHPFFERAGMVRYPVTPSPAAARLRAAMEAAGLDRRQTRSAAVMAEAVRRLATPERAWLETELQRWARSYLGAKTAQTMVPTLEQTCGYAARFLYSTPAYFLWSSLERTPEPAAD
ncbi:MAG: hypothetical protein JXL80_02000 [Planctomycetes bacterium]|nr:hypothetical protein [Planctomycetota bacterium]